GRNLGDIGEVGAVTSELHGGRAMAAFAVDQDECVIRRQTPQGGRAYEAVGIVDVLGVNVERWDQVAQHIVEVSSALILEVCRGENVYRSGGVQCGSRGSA